jgi:hypothetical protein
MNLKRMVFDCEYFIEVAKVDNVYLYLNH